MARPSRSAPIDYAEPHALTYGLLERACCPAEQPFVLLKDADKKGLRLRVTNAGGKHWQFETRLRSGKLFTRSLGEWPAISMEQARTQAHALRGLTEQGIDPRDAEKEEKERQRLASAQAQLENCTVAQVWEKYIEARTPHWGDLHRTDHIRLAQAGGVNAVRGTRGKKVTSPGPLYPLMQVPLKSLTPTMIEAWAIEEGKTRPTTGRLCLRLLKAFLTWCAEHPEYSALVSDRNPAKSKRTREALGKPGVKQDALLKEQLPAWFDAVRQISNQKISVFLQLLLLTGARSVDVIHLQWKDIDFKWRGMTIRDKIEGQRVIPLTPYVQSLLEGLPRDGELIFQSQFVTDRVTVISRPNSAHTQACEAAGIKHLTLHGLRRSFKSLTEWLNIPTGVVAQIMGHKPSATAEKHYTVRPLDLLRVHHEQIESWILEHGNVANRTSRDLA